MGEEGKPAADAEVETLAAPSAPPAPAEEAPAAPPAEEKAVDLPAPEEKLDDSKALAVVESKWRRKKPFPFLVHGIVLNFVVFGSDIWVGCVECGLFGS